MKISPQASLLTPEQLVHKQRLMKQLTRFLPQGALEYCSNRMMQYNLHLHIEVERKDRLGDYSPHLGKGNRISINHNLNPFDFLITFLHELAHHTAFKKYGNHHQPHGAEWKEEFKIHMRPVIGRGIFPAEVELALIRHMQRPAFTHTGDVQLVKALQRYDRTTTDLKMLDDLPAGALFKMSAKGRIILKKGEKRRTYIHCTGTDNGKKYLVHAVARVFPVDP